MSAIIEIDHHTRGYYDGQMAVFNPSLTPKSIAEEAEALDLPEIRAEINESLWRNEHAPDGLGLLALRTELDESDDSPGKAA